MNIELREHLNCLKERVFQTETKWPQFNLLLDDIIELSRHVNSVDVLFLERTLLYGGASLFAPFFSNANFTSIDCSPPSAECRGAYNSNMITDERFIFRSFDRRELLTEISLPSESLDLILIPNLIHHISEQEPLIKEASSALRPGGLLYIFEPTFREFHQIPDDFVRFTPFGLESLLKKAGLQMVSIRETGNVFEAIHYCWHQALEYLPEGEENDVKKWLHESHFSKLLELGRIYESNLKRENTRFPTAYSLKAKKS